jgi:D-threonine aldolase
MATEKQWYRIDNIDELDTPALVVYRNRVSDNINTLIKSINSVERLRPHVKTHKSLQVCELLLNAGIKKFKCATIAEAEMLAQAGAPDVLLAYQPVGPKIKRLVSLVNQYPSTSFSCLIDNLEAAMQIADAFGQQGSPLSVYIDLNVGMNRTGITPALAPSLFDSCKTLKGISIVGLHAYDGHLRDIDFAVRKNKCDEAFAHVMKVKDDIRNNFNAELKIVAGGTPTYSIHCKREEVECSPGTFIYWDKGYQDTLPEQQFSCAAVVVARIISKPSANSICVDLGHKAIAAENPLGQRVAFLNAPGLKPLGQSEEHLVLVIEDDSTYQIGDVLYGVPFHICPTVALHDQAALVEDSRITTYWKTSSRTRKITI